MTTMDSACPECDSKWYRDGRCMAYSIRQQDQQEQMRSRSGPEYDMSVTRARSAPPRGTPQDDPEGHFSP